MAADRYLAIETSSPRLSLAIADDQRVLAVHKGAHDWRHAESLFEGIQSLLSKVRWPVHSLTGVAVSIGPGSFTGIRIGLACARAMGQSLKIPVVGVSSLEIMAAGAKTKALWRAPRIDALRGQHFSALFKKEPAGLKRVLPETMAPIEKWPSLWRKKSRKESLWQSSLDQDYPDASALLELARPRFREAGTASYKTALPLYIRRSSAEERKK